MRSPFGTALFHVIREHLSYWDKRELVNPTKSSTVLFGTVIRSFAETGAAGSRVESVVPAREYLASCRCWATMDQSWRA
jgi:hypothetical protein